MTPSTSRGFAAALLLSSAASLVAQDGLPAVRGVAATDASSAGGYTLQIVYVNTPGHPTNLIPGLGIPFRAGGTATSAFERPIVSALGLHFGINVVAATGATTNDDVLLVDGAVVAREGDPTPWPTAGENVGTIDADFALNDAGDILLGNNTSATVNDDYIALLQGGVWTVLAQEAGLINPVLPAIVGGASGTWDDAMDSTVLLTSGTALWRAEGVDGLTTGTANDELIVLGGGAALQKGVDVPLGQAGGAMESWENFDLGDLYASPDGSVVLIQGDLTGATTGDDVVVLNGFVIVQEGVPLAGGPFVEPVDLDGIVKAWVDVGGSFYVRGNNDVTETDWVFRNGIVVAESSGADEVVPGSGEHWDDATFADCFFAFDGNLAGQFVLGGVTDGPVDTNGVLVFDDGLGFRTVLCRESDPIDLDGNGLFDDDRFFNTFGNDDVRLLDDGTVVFTATLKNGAGTAVDQGVFRLAPKTASCTVRNGSGVNPVACACATLPVLGTTWNVDVTPGPNTALTFLFASETPAPFPVPLFGGEALIFPPVAQIAGSGTHAVALPPSLQFLGYELFLQGMRLDVVGANLALVLTNAVDAVVGL